MSDHVDARSYDWTIWRTAKQIEEAAQKKVETHTGKRDFWKARKQEFLEKIKKDGIEISEDVALDFNKSYAASNSIHGPRVMIDDELQRKLIECHEKMTKHESIVKEFQAWVEFMRATSPASVGGIVLPQSSELSFMLKYNDFKYFYLD